MRTFVTVLAATMLLSAPMAFAQTDPAPTTPAPAATAPAEPSTTTAATPDATQGQTGDQAVDADHRVICRTQASVESRLRRNRERVCATRQQWESMQDQNARDQQQMGRVQGRTG